MKIQMQKHGDKHDTELEIETLGELWKLLWESGTEWTNEAYYFFGVTPNYFDEDCEVKGFEVTEHIGGDQIVEKLRRAEVHITLLEKEIVMLKASQTKTPGDGYLKALRELHSAIAELQNGEPL